MIYSAEKRAELLSDLVEWISEGGTLRAFARDRKVGYVTLYDWINSDPVVAERIARAREAGYEALAEEMLEIADDATNDYTERVNEKTGQSYTAFDDEHVQRSKLRIYTREKLLAKWFPQRYGDRQHVTHAGDPTQPITIVTGVPQPKAAPDDDVDLSMFE